MPGQLDTDTWLKVVVAGSVLHVYQYEKAPVGGGRRAGSRDGPEWLVPEEQRSVRGDQRATNQRLSRWKFIRLLNSNFNSGSRFVTLTFRDGAVSDVTDVGACNRKWEIFLRKLRRKYGKDFRWMLSTEFQDARGRGAVHFHVIWNLPYIPHDELERIWGNGFLKVNRIEHVDNVGAYVSKYMVKDLDDRRLCGFKAWRGSQNLDKPLVLRGEEARDLLKNVESLLREPVYSSGYDSDFCGRIDYSQFNLERL